MTTSGGAVGSGTSPRFEIISVDDHLVEPPHTFRSYTSSRWVDRMPEMAVRDHGGYGWDFDGQAHTSYGVEAVAGTSSERWTLPSLPFSELEPAYVDPVARAEAMDRDGVRASLCFPSMWCGFAGRVFQACSDPALGLETVRAYNRWHLEEWVGRAPGRFIPMQLPWIVDPVVGAAEIVRNAELGFRAVSFVDQPHHLGFPHISSTYWDPILRACEETGTVVCLHCGSGGWMLRPRPEAFDVLLDASLFQGAALVTAADWTWAAIPLRFPNLKISLSEGGIGWVTMLLERLDYVVDHSASVAVNPYQGADVKPSEALLRNFWFCTIHDRAAMDHRDLIGNENIMVETDFPHTDSPYPRSQEFLGEMLHGVTPDQAHAITSGNAAALFRFPVSGPAGSAPAVTARPTAPADAAY